MLNIIKIRKNQGYQAIPDVKTAAIHEKFRGFPVIKSGECDEGCNECRNICPTKAIAHSPLSIDMGKCIFCGDCERACAKKALTFSNFHRIASDRRDFLIIDGTETPEVFETKAITARKEIISLFGRSLKLRQVSAGGCNSCEMELNACSNVNFDMQRFGIEFVASPRHADGVVITGPVTEHMIKALEDTYLSIPEPRIVISAGSCAISGGVFEGSPAIDRSFFDKHKVDLFVPGCPIHPLTFVNGILRMIGA